VKYSLIMNLKLNLIIITNKYLLQEANIIQIKDKYHYCEINMLHAQDITITINASVTYKLGLGIIIGITGFNCSINYC
jgi:hypothetical protein